MLPFTAVGAVKAISLIVKEIAGARVEAKNAATERERIEAEERARALEARRDLMIAEAGRSRWNMIMRGVLALPVAILIWKIMVYDKALGEWTGGRTDALDDNLWMIVSVVLGFYFLDKTLDRFKR